MKTTTIIAALSLLAVAGLATDALAEATLGESVLTGTASASCISDVVTNQCHSLCAPAPEPLRWDCTM